MTWLPDDTSDWTVNTCVPICRFFPTKIVAVVCWLILIDVVVSVTSLEIVVLVGIAVVILLIVVLDLNTRGGDNKIVLKSSLFVVVFVAPFNVNVLVVVLIAVTFVLILNRLSITSWCIKFLVRMYADTV